MPYVVLVAGGATRVSRRAKGSNPEFWQDFQFPNIDPITDATGAGAYTRPLFSST
jgi:hypothetical protein